MLFQQGTQRIEVIVRKDVGATDIGAKEKNADEAVDKKGSGLDAQARANNRMVRVNLTHTFAASKEITFRAISYYQTGIGMRTGDQSLQEASMRQLEIVKDTTNLATSVAMGMLYGTTGGPIGIAIGGLVAASTATASLIFKYAERQREFNYKRFKQDNAIEYRRARANINLTTGRLR